jgi:hypothetical protein
MPNGYDPNTDTLKPIPDPEALEGYTTPEVLPTIVGLQGLTPTKLGEVAVGTIIDGGNVN